MKVTLMEEGRKGKKTGEKCWWAIRRGKESTRQRIGWIENKVKGGRKLVQEEKILCKN